MDRGLAACSLPRESQAARLRGGVEPPALPVQRLRSSSRPPRSMPATDAWALVPEAWRFLVAHSAPVRYRSAHLPHRGAASGHPSQGKAEGVPGFAALHLQATMSSPAPAAECVTEYP